VVSETWVLMAATAAWAPGRERSTQALPRLALIGNG
jgi:hypothetical protein